MTKSLGCEHPRRASHPSRLAGTIEIALQTTHRSSHRHAVAMTFDIAAVSDASIDQATGARVAATFDAATANIASIDQATGVRVAAAFDAATVNNAFREDSAFASP